MKKCPDCKVGSCGDDHHTNTKYKKEAKCGNRLKVILLQIYDMVYQDNLQKSEIKALINNLINEHITEIDRNNDE